MNKIFSIVLALFFSYPSLGQVSILSNSQIQLIARLEAPQIFGYYGTTILVYANSKELIFVTNEHLVNVDANLLIHSPIFNNAPLNARVIAKAPGLDLALLAVENNLAMTASLTKKITQTIHSTLHQSFLTQTAQQLALAGYQGFKFPQDLTIQLPIGTEHLPISFTNESVCPPPFLNLCYRVPIRSWGFSGSALIAKPGPENKGTIIAGMVSHFAPLAFDTYVVPMPVIVNFVKRVLSIRTEDNKGIVNERLDQDGWYEYVNSSTIKILRGSLQGQTVRIYDRNERYANDFPWIKGGHESVGGGRDLEANRSALFNGSFAILPINYESLLRDMIHPENWNKSRSTVADTLNMMPHFRGVGRLLRFQPAIFLERSDAQSQTIYSYDGATMNSLSEFLTAYRRNSDASIDSVTQLVRLPKIMALVDHSRKGLTVRSHLLKIDSKLTMRNLRADTSAGALEASIINDLIKRAFGESVNTVITNQLPQELRAIYSAELSIRAKGFSLKFFNENGVLTRYETNQPWIQLSPHVFKVVGTFTIDDYSSALRAAREYGVAILQYIAPRKEYELKIISLRSEKVADRESAIVKADPSVVTSGVFVPFNRASFD